MVWNPKLPGATSQRDNIEDPYVPPVTDSGSGVLRGTGFPTGTPALGTEYLDNAETNGALKWIYTTAGWKVSVGDTGWRNIKSLFSNVDMNDGKTRVQIRRTQSGVTFWVMGVQTTVFEDPCFAAIPLGWRPTLGQVFSVPYGYGFDYFDANVTGQIGVGSNEAGVDRPDRLFIRPGNGYRDIKAAQLIYLPDSAVAWPTTLPGTAVV